MLLKISTMLQALILTYLRRLFWKVFTSSILDCKK